MWSFGKTVDPVLGEERTDRQTLGRSEGEGQLAVPGQHRHHLRQETPEQGGLGEGSEGRCHIPGPGCWRLS